VNFISAFGVADEAALPSQLRPLVAEGGIDQLTLRLPSIRPLVSRFR